MDNLDLVKFGEKRKFRKLQQVGTSVSNSAETTFQNRDKKHKIVPSVATEQDHQVLKKNYTFLPDQKVQQQTWQGRMVLRYHQHLYKDYVLANTTRAHSHRQLGLRWRTEKEVRRGKGSTSCGNLQCHSHKDKTRKDAWEQKRAVQSYRDTSDPCNESEEQKNLTLLSYGDIMENFEVPFTYKEQDDTKTELVKLCLCARCAPLLFVSRGNSTPSLAARQQRRENGLRLGEKKMIKDC